MPVDRALVGAQRAGAVNARRGGRMRPNARATTFPQEI